MSESSKPVSLAALRATAGAEGTVRKPRARESRGGSSVPRNSEALEQKKAQHTSVPAESQHDEYTRNDSSPRKSKRAFESHKQPGRARVVEFPSGVLDHETYEALLEHATSSLLYYGSHYNYTEGQLRDKLIKKGYPDGVCRIDWDGTGDVVEENIIDLAVEKCYQNNLVIDETAVAVRTARTMSKSGRSPSLIMNKLRSRKFNDDALRAAHDYLESSGAAQDSTRLAVQRCYHSLVASGMDAGVAREKTIRRMFSRGFSYDDVMSAVNDVCQQ